MTTNATISQSNPDTNPASTQGNTLAIRPSRPVFLSAKKVQELIGLSESTIRRLRISGDFPKPFRLTPCATGHLRWDEAEILNWLQIRREADTSTRI